MSIESISNIQSTVSGALQPEQGVSGSMGVERSEFLQLISQKVGEVNNEIASANTLFTSYIKGEKVEVHDVMIAMSKAKTELTLFVQVRDKILESYKEITRIQL